jgi:hypothetical protein
VNPYVLTSSGGCCLHFRLKHVKSCEIPSYIKYHLVI